MVDELGSTKESVLQKARERQPEGWIRFVALYSPWLHQIFERMRVPECNREELVQEVILKVYHKIDQFQYRKPEDSFRAWLRTLARNVAIDRYRREKRRRQAEQQVAIPEIHDLSEIDDESDRHFLLRRALELIRVTFKDRTFQAFERMYLDPVKRNAADVGAELGMTAANVRMATSRVLQALKDQFGELI